jgi:hypothetical protein
VSAIFQNLKGCGKVFQSDFMNKKPHQGAAIAIVTVISARIKFITILVWE